MPAMRRLGLLGGTSWESTAHYYRGLNEGVRARLGGHHSADLLLRSVDFADVVRLQEAGDWAELGRRYAAEAAALAGAGAQVLGILANTMHLVHDDVVRGSGLEVVHVVDVVGRAARDLGVTAVGLLGTAYTMAHPTLYPERLAAHGVRTLVPNEADQAEVHRIIYAELVHGQVRDSSRDTLRDVVGRLADAGAGAAVLGCTELAMLLDANDPAAAPLPLLDTTSLHVTALLDAALAPQASAVHTEEGAA